MGNQQTIRRTYRRGNFNVKPAQYEQGSLYFGMAKNGWTVIDKLVTRLDDQEIKSDAENEQNLVERLCPAV